MSPSEEITLKWLQTTVLPNSLGTYLEPYFHQLLINGLDESDIMLLPADIFFWHDRANFAIAPRSVSFYQYCNSYIRYLKLKRIKKQAELN